MMSQPSKEKENNYGSSERGFPNDRKEYSYNDLASNNQGSSWTTEKITRGEAHHYERKINELTETIEILQIKLKTVTEAKLKVLTRLKSDQDESEQLRDQIGRQALTNKRLTEEVAFLKDKNASITDGNRLSNEKFKTKFEILNKEIEEKEIQLEKLISQTKAKDKTIKYFSVANEGIIRNGDLCKAESDKLKELNLKYEDKIRELERKIDHLYVNTKSQSALELQLEHLKDDNIRLLKMLKTTNEFRDFAYLSENVEGGVTFVKRTQSKPSTKRPNTATYKYNSNYPFNKECERKKIEGENILNGDNWVPSDAYKCITEFRTQFNIEMSDSLVNELLSSLNRIWRDSENKQISKLKTKYLSEIMNLKRNSNMKVNLDEFTANKKISKLKKDLKNVREDLRTQIVQKNKNRDTPSGIDLVDNALKVASSFQKTKKYLDNEIVNLKKRLQEKENVSLNENFEKLKFNEGGFWIINRVLDELNVVLHQFEDLYAEFEERIKNVTNFNFSSVDLLQFNSKILSNSKKWYKDSLTEILSEIRNKFQKWQRDIQKNFESLKYTF